MLFDSLTDLAALYFALSPTREERERRRQQQLDELWQEEHFDLDAYKERFERDYPGQLARCEMLRRRFNRELLAKDYALYQLEEKLSVEAWEETKQWSDRLVVDLPCHWFLSLPAEDEALLCHDDPEEAAEVLPSLLLYLNAWRRCFRDWCREQAHYQVPHEYLRLLDLPDTEGLRTQPWNPDYSDLRCTELLRSVCLDEFLPQLENF